MLHIILVTEDVALHQRLIASRRFGRTVPYQCRFCTSAVSEPYLSFSTKTARRRHVRRKTHSRSAHHENSNVHRRCHKSRLQLNLFHTYRSSSIQDPSRKPKFLQWHLTSTSPNKYQFVLINYSHQAACTFKLHPIIQFVPHSKHRCVYVCVYNTA